MHFNMPASTGPPADIPTMTSRGKGKGKSTTRKTAPQTATIVNLSDDDEGADILKQLERQKGNYDKIQDKLVTMLDAEQQSAMSQFGNFLGRLGLQIDERLVNGYYRDALDLTIKTIERSRSLPPIQRHPLPTAPVPLQQPQQQFHQQQHFQQAQEQFQQPQQQPQTFTAMFGGPLHQSQQQQPSTSTWDTYQPSSGSNTAQLVVPPRPWSTPNVSLSSLPRLSDISQTLMTPEDPSLRPQSPSATSGFTGDGAGFSL